MPVSTKGKGSEACKQAVITLFFIVARDFLNFFIVLSAVYI